MRRYRYRTAVLTGPWRDSEEEAGRDAIKARQAEPGEDAPFAVRWIVPGRIEDEIVGQAGRRVGSRAR